MSITFTNVLKENILDNLQTIISTEFNKMPIFYDVEFQERGHTTLINIKVETDETTERFNAGQLRKFTLSIRLYQLLQGRVTADHTQKKHIRFTERLRSLLEQKSNYAVSGVTQWFDGQVELVEYQPGLDDAEENYTVSALTFSASIFEQTT